MAGENVSLIILEFYHWYSLRKIKATIALRKIENTTWNFDNFYAWIKYINLQKSAIS